MLRISRFIKPFLGSLALALLLLFVQALSDLNLPNLMSDIVNVGIQQGGIEDRSPVAVSSEGMELSQSFMDEDQRELVGTSYKLVLPSDSAPDGKPWSSKYPAASVDGFYVLKEDVSSETRSMLDDAFGISTWTMIKILQEFSENGTKNLGIELPPDAAESNEDVELSTDLQELDFSQIYRVLPFIKMIPSDTLAHFRTEAQGVDELVRNESAIMLTRSFYGELGVDLNDIEISYILRVGLTMLLITLVGGAATVLVGLLSSRIGAGLARDLRSAVFSKVMSFSHTEFDRFSTASLITRSTNDVTQIQMVATLGIRMVFYAPIMGAGAVFMAVQKSASMSWIMGIAVLFMLCMVGVLMVIIMPKFKIIQKLIDRLNLVARETLTGQMVIRAFSRAPFQMERFEEANRDVTKTNLFIQRAMVFMLPVMMIFMNALTVLIIWVGAGQVAASQMQVGDMMAYMQYAMMMVMSFMFIAMAFIFVPRASVSAGRIADILETHPVITSPANPVRIPDSLPDKERGRIEFRDVSFSFEGAEAKALDAITMVVKPRSTTAIIGSTGSGKSTILNLIPRFYDVTEGAVLFDGVDVRQLDTDDLRSRIGYVPQKSLLMHGSIAENISYGCSSLPPEDVEKVAEVAQALDFITNLENNAGPEGELDLESDSNVQNMQQNHELHQEELPGWEPVPEEEQNHQYHHQEELPGWEPVPERQQGYGSRCQEQQKDTSGQDPSQDKELPEGFSYELAQGGTNISGGQRQRLAIARALAIHPEVFLFDDSFSALDYATDAALRKALSSFTRNTTMLIVAQRVSTIMDADIIYVIDEGRIIGKGTHAELLRTCTAYREIAESQLSPEEIKASLGGDAR